MALQDHAQMRAFVDSNFLVEITSISAVTESGQVEVMTLEGLVGFSKSGGVKRISIGYAIPSNGPEFNFDAAAVEGGYHTLQITLGALDYVGEGKFMTGTIGQTAGSATEGSIDFVGEPKAFE